MATKCDQELNPFAPRSEPCWSTNCSNSIRGTSLRICWKTLQNRCTTGPPPFFELRQPDSTETRWYYSPFIQKLFWTGVFLDSLFQVPHPSEDTSSFTSDELSRISADLCDVREQLRQLRTARSAGQSGDTDTIESADELAANVAAKLDARYAAESLDARSTTQIRRTFDTAMGRLREESATLMRRANVNLFIGVVTTVVAVGLLLYMIAPAKEIPTWTLLASHYIPRITTVALIEGFGFFFLRLYKTILGDIKFYQNELTILALQSNAYEASRHGTPNAIVVEQFAKVDRNKSNTGDTNAVTSLELKAIAELLSKLSELLAKSTKT